MMDRVRPAPGLRIHDSHFQDHHDSLLMYVHRKQFFNANFNLFIYFAKIQQKISAYMLMKKTLFQLITSTLDFT